MSKPEELELRREARDPQIHPRDPHPQTHHHQHPHSPDPQTRLGDPQTQPWDPQDPHPHPLGHHPLCPCPLDPYLRDPIPRDTCRHLHPREPHAQPRSFLVSLRTLFDILDQEGRGSVELREIESRWTGEGRREAALPAGLMACLRRAAAPSGRLTFPRLLAGIRAALQQEACNPEPDSVPGSPRYQQPGGTQRETPAASNRSWATAATDCKGLGAGATSLGLGSDATSLGLGTPKRSSQEDKDLRHCTIADSSDSIMLKELECQRDALLHGLEVVEWARDWYHQQIHALHQRQKHVRRVFGNKGTPTQPETSLVNIYGRSSLPEDQLTQPPQDQACRLLAKIQEVNCCLGELICSSGKVPFSAPRLNGFGSPPRGQPFQQQSVSSLREQNHLLTKELSSKRERIAILEQDKASLVKQLAEAREQGQPAVLIHTGEVKARHEALL
ncbi:suppressor APC domain-containing protein 2-like [Stegostoma tigrinum]|uniref:suppressor APC domain-containing protein 2-like n=1 Tax=Stegostoma tigrinum TaxID=3053191 RepID=UPI00287050DE|nr:suppressor APC domain-containing protein 2-like [Stegostoma tigrinum]